MNHDLREATWVHTCSTALAHCLPNHLWSTTSLALDYLPHLSTTCRLNMPVFWNWPLYIPLTSCIHLSSQTGPFTFLWPPAYTCFLKLALLCSWLLTTFPTYMLPANWIHLSSETGPCRHLPSAYFPLDHPVSQVRKSSEPTIVGAIPFLLPSESSELVSRLAGLFCPATCYTLVSCSADFWPWRRRWYGPPKLWFTHRLHSTMSQKMTTFIITAVSMSNPACGNIPLQAFELK
jgi:hypothetical protein